MDMQYISAFLAKVEGPIQTRGYIPCNVTTGGTANYRGGPHPERYSPMGVSGVTIATGCDLGQTDAKAMQRYGLPASIVSIFTPYYRRRQDKAVLALHRKPLIIEEEVACAVNHAVHGGYLMRYVIPAYDAESAVPFASIPVQAQAVIMSLCFQKGCGGVRRDWPLVWGYLTHQKWREASEELCSGFRHYAPRRKVEGTLLRQLY